MNLSQFKRMFGLVVAGLFAATLAGQAVAAVDGTAGATSTGSLNIKLQINDVVRISNFTDINLGVFTGTNLSGTDNLCVYRNATGAYNVTATGSGVASAFTVTNGVNTAPYTVEYNDGSGFTPITTGFLLSGQTGADPSSLTCANTGDNATVKVGISATSMAGLPMGLYTGTLTLTVAPE